ncbi:MAG TPA: PQQ-binding-like beta-propeller repeat protein, partial [Acidobacteriota bacterium]|nr:PQQ-binding-like beta-propeller repeat protein [Acidobacteriota bacterium]
LSARAGEDWTRWRGPNMDLSVKGSGTFEPDRKYRLEVAWRRPLGPGYSAVSLAGGIAVTAFASGEHDVVAAFDAATGEERWRTPVGPRYPGHWGSQDGPISTPLIADGRVFIVDTGGRLAALDLADGSVIWSSDLAEDHDSPAPFYGFATSPIPFDDLVIVQTGGKQAAIAAFQADTGEVRWACCQGAVNYQSPFIADFEGEPLLLGVGDKRLFGVDPRSGRQLWSVEHGGDGSVIGSMSSNIVPTSNHRFFLKNRASGSKLFELVGPEQGGVREVWSSRSIRGTYVVAVHHDGYIYGPSGRIMTAISAETGETAWKSRTPSDGFPIVVDGHLVVATKDGALSVGRASPQGYQEMAGLNLFDDLVWTPASFYQGSFYLRSMSELARVDVVEASVPMALDRERPGVLPESDFAKWVAKTESSADPGAEIDRFLQSQPRLPVIEDKDKVHFIYRGPGRDIALVSDLFGGRTDRPMNRIADTDFFYYSSPLEPDARITYGFLRDFEHWVLDDRNPQRDERYYGDSRSVVTMPDWRPPGFLHEATPRRRGRLEEVPFSSSHRQIHLPLKVYLPADYDPDQRYPVLYIHAGTLEILFGRMVQTLDNLIGQSVQPLIAVFIPAPGERPNGASNGYTIYQSYSGAEKDATRRMLVEEVVPLVEERYPIIDDPQSRGLVGGDYTAFASFYAAAKHPDLFARLGLRSIVYESAYREEYAALLASPQEQPLTVYLEWGKYDDKSEKEGWDARADSMAFARMLRSKGYSYVGGETHDGAGFSSWRNRTDRLLQTLFPLKKD